MLRRITDNGEHSIGETMKEQRLARGLTLREAADLAGVTMVSLSRWENGKRTPTVDSFNRVMTALGARVVCVSLDKKTGISVDLDI